MKRLVTILLTMLLLPALALGMIGIAPALQERAEDSSLLQFVAGNHVLGFDSRGMVAASGDHALRVDFVRADEVQPQPDSAASFGRVVYAGLWEGIRLEYASLADGLYATTYTLAPGADANQIRLRYNAPVTLNENGTLTVAFENGAFTESAPIAWQEVNGARAPVEVAFRLRGQEVGFALGAYDPHYGVTIDPSIVWNTFLGSASLDWGYGIARDGSGNLYVCGYSGATWGSPVRAFSTTANDAFVAKLDASGSLLWNTFLGGSGGDGCTDIVFNGSEILVTGSSSAAWGSPTRAYSSGNDAFAAKLNASSGALIWNTFLGGSGSDHGNGISFANPGGYVYVSGDSDANWGSSPTRYYTAGTDGFAAKLDSSGALVWHCFLGGSGTDYGDDIYALSSGAIYAVGTSNAAWGAPGDPYSAGDDAFITLLNGSGFISWLSFLGGSDNDSAISIYVPSAGSEYVAGTSSATWGSPIRAFSNFEDAFLAKVGASGALTWHTFLGGGSTDAGRGVVTDSSGNVYVTGVSSATWGSPLGAFSAGGDIFVAKLTSAGSLSSNTFAGGAGYDSGHSIVVDSSGNTYVAGASNATWGSPLRAYGGGGGDAVAAKIDVQQPSVSSISYLDSNPTNDASVEYQVTFSEDITGVLISDFGLSTSGLSFASISGVGCAGSICTVTVNTGTGDGTLHLRVMGWADIWDLAGNPITGIPYLGGPTYTIDKTAPTVVSITRADPSPTAAASVDFTVTFSESVTGVDASDFTLTTTGVSGATVSGVSGSGSVYTVTVNTGSGSGTIRLDVVTGGSIVDAALNPLTAGFTTGEVYSVIKSATFTDVPLDYWASTFIERLYNAGITGGCSLSPLMYCPETYVNRAQMAVFLLRGEYGSAYVPPDVGTGTGFTDVPADYWAAAWIKQLAAEGITSGCGPSLYCPETSVTRDQMAVFLLRAEHGASYSPPPATGVFTDVPTDHWAAAWIERLAAEGVTSGCGVDTYCPSTPVTRAQMAVFLVRTFNLP